MHPTTQRVYDVICDYISRDIHPTYREIATNCNMAPTSILRHVDRLEGMGWIVREEGKVRSIRLGASGPHLVKKRD
jgi:DNA-binding MarR family transcriptional regulator